MIKVPEKRYKYNINAAADKKMQLVGHVIHN